MPNLTRIVCLLLLVLFFKPIFSQEYTIHGYIQDSESKEKLLGVNVYETDQFTGTTTNNFGFYSLTLPAGKHTIVYSFVGFQSDTLEVSLNSDTTITINLKNSLTLSEFELVATEQEKVNETTQMSTIKVPIRMVEKLPVFLGEKDIIKTLQLLPGVQSGSEGSSGLYVRGGGPDQNLLLLDGVPIYNASHLFGFFSTFTPEAVNSVSLTKGGFPARYGGRLSSVIDVRLKDGNQTEFKGEATLGLVSSKLTLEGPLKKDKSSFIISARRTYIDLLAKPIIKASSPPGTNQDVGYYFYDLTAKVNYTLNKNNRLFVSGYLGNDKAYSNIDEQWQQGGDDFGSSINADLEWGNRILAVRWNSILNKKLFANTTLTYSKYNFYIDNQFTENINQESISDFGINYNSYIQDYTLKVDLDYIPNTKHYLKMGIGDTYHTFLPGVTSFNQSTDTLDFDTTLGAKNTKAHELYVYLEDDFKVNHRIKTNLGLHISSFILSNDAYFSVQPRFSALYKLNETSSLKASFSTMAQYVHLLTNSTVGLPTDLWVPSTENVTPQRSMQVALGYARTIGTKYEFTAETYYKAMDGLMEYKEGATFFGNNEQWDNKVLQGKGESYGLELFLQKKTGKTTGWIGYTLAWANRTFEELNFGNTYPYKYDRRHDLSIAITHQINEKWDVGAVFVYGTGNSISLATTQFNAFSNFSWWGGQQVEYFKERNGYRAPNYNRLDIGFNNTKTTKWGERIWSYGVYNAYSRLNPFYLYWGNDINGNRELYQVSLFPIIPSISFTAKF